jgi:hypothetical protein
MQSPVLRYVAAAGFLAGRHKRPFEKQSPSEHLAGVLFSTNRPVTPTSKPPSLILATSPCSPSYGRRVEHRVAAVPVLFYICDMHNGEEIVARRTVDVAVIIPDASPVLTPCASGGSICSGAYGRANPAPRGAK